MRGGRGGYRYHGGARVIITPHGIIIDDSDDDDYYQGGYTGGYGGRRGGRGSDRYNFSCEYTCGCSHGNKSRYSRPSNLYSERPMSKKKMRKEMKREYNAERDETRNSYGDRDYRTYLPRSAPKNEYDDYKWTGPDQSSASAPKKKKEKEREVKLSQPKKLTKKQQLAEQRRREQEMEEIAKELEKQQLIEKEKEEKRLARKKEKEEEEAKKTPVKNYQKGKDDGVDEDIKARLLESERRAMEAEKLVTEADKPKKSTKRARRKQNMKKAMQELNNNTKTCEDANAKEMFHTTTTTTTTAEKFYQEPFQAKPKQKPSVPADVVVLRTSNGNSRYQKPVYRKPNFNKPNQATDQKKNYRRPQHVGSSTSGINRNRDGQYQNRFVPPRMQQKSFGEKSAWEEGAPNPKITQNKPDNTYFPQSVPPPAPQPANNVWQDRQEFYHGAVPGSAAEEEEMLKRALEMSALQSEQEDLARKMHLEEMEFKQVEAERKKREEEERLRMEAAEREAMLKTMYGSQSRSSAPKAVPELKQQPLNGMNGYRFPPTGMLDRDTTGRQSPPWPTDNATVNSNQNRSSNEPNCNPPIGSFRNSTRNGGFGDSAKPGSFGASTKSGSFGDSILAGTRGLGNSTRAEQHSKISSNGRDINPALHRQTGAPPTKPFSEPFPSAYESSGFKIADELGSRNTREPFVKRDFGGARPKAANFAPTRDESKEDWDAEIAEIQASQAVSSTSNNLNNPPSSEPPKAISPLNDEEEYESDDELESSSSESSSGEDSGDSYKSAPVEPPPGIDDIMVGDIGSSGKENNCPRNTSSPQSVPTSPGDAAGSAVPALQNMFSYGNMYPQMPMMGMYPWGMGMAPMPSYPMYHPPPQPVTSVTTQPTSPSSGNGGPMVSGPPIRPPVMPAMMPGPMPMYPMPMMPMMPPTPGIPCPPQARGGMEQTATHSTLG